LALFKTCNEIGRVCECKEMRNTRVASRSIVFVDKNIMKVCRVSIMLGAKLYLLVELGVRDHLVTNL